jgi:hypothetical protein
VSLRNEDALYQELQGLLEKALHIFPEELGESLLLSRRRPRLRGRPR